MLRQIGDEPDAKPVKKTVKASDGLSLACDVRGKGDTALVLLHGWGGDREYWKNQTDVFAADYKVVTLDQAGHGESGKDRKAWTVESLAGDVESVVKDLGLKRVILVGHSMGGPVALLAAKRMPGTVVAVIGVDTLQDAEFKQPEELLKPILDGLEKDFKGTVRPCSTAARREGGSGVEEVARGQGSKARTRRSPLPSCGTCSPSTRGSVKEARVPVRCINSAGGYKFFTPTAVETNKKYADFDAVTIRGVGHYPMLEKPKEFNHKLGEVLKEFATRK